MKRAKPWRQIFDVFAWAETNVCWPAIGFGIAAAVAIYLGFDLIQTSAAFAAQAQAPRTLASDRIALMLVANIASVIGAGVSVAVARGRMAGNRLVRHGYAVWLLTTVVFMTQIALTTGLG